MSINVYDLFLRCNHPSTGNGRPRHSVEANRVGEILALIYTD